MKVIIWPKIKIGNKRIQRIHYRILFHTTYFLPNYLKLQIPFFLTADFFIVSHNCYYYYCHCNKIIIKGLMFKKKKLINKKNVTKQGLKKIKTVSLAI